MEKRCRNCANGTWTKGRDAVPEVCLECEYVHGEPSNWKEKTMTNADRIRAMSDEELANWMAECNAYGERAEASQWLPWLKEPAEVD